ncbi:conjugal transfer protein TraB [Candidatus Woesearchaeota archaeon]|nr:conjugal transfer protein TraB [Candidatus Woesearchaeota archaeon]
MADAPVIDVRENLRLLGTAHIATSSVEAVRQHIAEYQPDIVAVELCQSRHDTLVSDRRLDKEGLLKVIKEGKAPMVLLQSMLSAEQRKLGINEGQQPGAELLAAVQAANEVGCEVALVDRDIQTTLRRAWKRMRLREKWRLLTSLLEDEEEDEDLDVNELLQDSDLLSSMMEELKGFSPGAGEVLIDERDAYIASKLDGLDGTKRILAVLGAGHLNGVAQKMSDEPDSIDSEALETLPSPSVVRRFLPWAFPLVMIGVLAAVISTSRDVDWLTFFTVWTAANAVFAALACLIARGHPLAVLTAALASPITSLNPALAAGWFAGYVQLKLAEPTAEDLQQFLKLEDLSSFWSNPAGKVLLVTALTNLGSMLGAWAAPIILLGGLGLG